MGILAVVGSVLKSGFGMFTTLDKQKWAARHEQIALVMGALSKKEKLGMFGIFGGIVVLVLVGVDLATTGGANFDSLLQLLVVVLAGG